MIDASNYLSILELNEFANFQLFHDRNPLEYHARVLQGSFATLSEELRELNQQGYSVCVQVNGGTGRKSHEIKEVRWHYADFDNVDVIPKLPFEPHMVVKTKRGFHVYWRIERSTNLDLWDRVQKALVGFIGADSGVNSINQVLRVAGFDHHKEEPFTITIASLTPNQRDYTDSELAKILNVPLTLPPEARLDLVANFKMTVSTNEQRILFPIVKKVLNNQIHKIRQAKEGNRYKSVRSAAFCLGSYIHWGLNKGPDKELAFSSLLKVIVKRGWTDADLTVKQLERLIRNGLKAGYVKGPPVFTERVKQQLQVIASQDETARKISDQSANWPDQVTTSDIKRIVQTSGIDAESCWGGKAYGHALVKIIYESGYQKSRKSNGVQHFERATVFPKSPVLRGEILIRDSTV